MRHLLELVFILIIILFIIGLAAGGEEGQAMTTSTQIHVGADPAGGWSFSAGPPGRYVEPYDRQPCNKADHGTLSTSGKWICIEHYNPPGYWWRPWPEPAAQPPVKQR